MEIYDKLLHKVTDDDIINGTFTIPDSVCFIGESAFENCEFLKYINIPKNVKFISDRMFKNCISLTSITISDSVEYIGKSAFENCTSLTNIIIPESVKKIEASAFKDCTSLINITIPEKIDIINENTFNGCISLKNINIMGNLKKIENRAFRNCKNLRKFFVSKDIKFLDLRAFIGCKKLDLNIETSLTNFYLEEFLFNYYKRNNFILTEFKRLRIYKKNIKYNNIVSYDYYVGYSTKNIPEFNSYIIKFIMLVRNEELFNLIKIKLRKHDIKKFKYLKYEEHKNFLSRLLNKINEQGINFDYMVEIDNYVNKYIKACISTPNLLTPNKFINDDIKSIDTSEKIEDEIIKNDIINSNNANDTICEEMEVTDNSINSNQLNNNLSNVFKRLSELPSDDIALIKDMVKNDFFDENIEKYINMSREEKIEFLNAQSRELNKEESLKRESQESNKPKVSLEKEPIEEYKARQKQILKKYIDFNK